jgi:hypothetical protein
MNKSTSAPKIKTSEKALVKSDEREAIFKQLKELFYPFVPPLTVSKDTSTNYELISGKPINYMGVKKDSMYFGALIIQSSYAGLYLMHVYTHPENLNKLGPELRKTLKGKSCFHIKKLDQNLLKQIKQAISDGVKCYKRAGFI